MFDLLSISVSRILVSSLAKRDSVVLPRSNLILNVLTRLVELGYILGFKILDSKGIVVFLKYSENAPVIRQIVRVSTPGNRRFYNYRFLRQLNGNKVQGFLLLSTSRGILTDQECFFYRVGGEPLLLVF